MNYFGQTPADFSPDFAQSNRFLSSMEGAYWGAQTQSLSWSLWNRHCAEEIRKWKAGSSTFTSHCLAQSLLLLAGRQQLGDYWDVYPYSYSHSTRHVVHSGLSKTTACAYSLKSGMVGISKCVLEIRQDSGGRKCVCVCVFFKAGRNHHNKQCIILVTVTHCVSCVCH